MHRGKIRVCHYHLRPPARTELQLKTTCQNRTATEDYLPGALGEPAEGYELNLNVPGDGPQPSAGPPTAPGR